MRVIAGGTYALLAFIFAVAGAYLLYFAITDRRLLGFGFVLVFALGSAVAIRSARESFARSTADGVRSD